MTTNTLSSPRAPSHHWLLRAWRLLADAAAQMRLAWCDRQRIDREHRERMLLAELDPRVLRDIGAPDWMEGEAGALRAACNDEREQLRRGGAVIDTRFW